MKKKKFRGGFRFKNFIGQPLERLVKAAIPNSVIIPLSQGFGSPLAPMVNVGDQVKAGQIIARDDNTTSSPIHASIAGKVTAIEKKNYFNKEITMVSIAGDGSTDYQKLEGHTTAWRNLPVEKLEELLYLSGVTSLPLSGLPTRFKSSGIEPSQVEDIIIHATGSEAYNISPNILLEGKKLYNFADAVGILQKIMPNARVHMVLNKERKGLIEKIGKLTSSLKNVKTYLVEPKFPHGYDEVLVPTIVGKRFPHGYSSANIGVIVINLQAAMQVYEAVCEGKPLIERTIALAGPQFKDTPHLKVRIGSSLEQVTRGKLKEGKTRIVLNSLLTGFELKDLSLPIDRMFSQIIAMPDNEDREFLEFVRLGFKSESYSNAFLARWLGTAKMPDTKEHGEPRACIQCGYCMTACPVAINPALLNRYAKTSSEDLLIRYQLFKCVDCNLCSYVCPSKIPLASNLKKARTKLTEMGCDNYICVKPKYDLKGLEDYKGVKVVR